MPKKIYASVMTWIVIGGLYLLLPLLPMLASLAYQKSQYVLQYWRTLKKMLIHLEALSQGPVHRYFQDGARRGTDVPAEILGSCTQCGNCCLNKRCAFLEQVADDKYQCGIYHAPLRRYSNCGSFPINAEDIERYACPGYTAVKEAPVQWLQRAAGAK